MLKSKIDSQYNVIEITPKEVFLKLVTSKYDIIAWGGRSYHYRGKTKEEDAYEQALEFLKERDDAAPDEEDTPEVKDSDFAAEELQPGLKQTVLKSRSKNERIAAIPKINDQVFLFQQALSSTQNIDVRVRAAQYVTQQDLVVKLAEVYSDADIKNEALKNLTDQKLLLKYAEEGYSDALKNIQDEESLTKAVVKMLKESQPVDWVLSGMLFKKIKKDNNILSIAKAIDQKDYDSSFSAMVHNSSDPQVLNICINQPYASYQPFASAALIKLNDKAVAKKVVLNPKKEAEIREVALRVADDEELYKKAYLADPKLTQALDHIKDDPFLKSIYTKSKSAKKPNYDTLPIIEDQDFLKKVIKEDPVAAQYAIQGIKDQAFLKELLKKKEEKDKSLLNVQVSDILRNIDDEELLKKSYAEGLTKLNTVWEKHQADEEGNRRKTRFDFSSDDPTNRLREAALEKITDNKFLLKVYRGDKNPGVRRTALSLIKDEKILKDILSKEKRKTEKIDLIDTLKENQQFLIDLIDSEVDPDILSEIYRRIDDADLVKKYILNHPQYTIRNDFFNLIENDAEFIAKLLKKKDIATSLRDQLITTLKDKKTVISYAKEHFQRLIKEDDLGVLDKAIDLSDKDDADFLKQIAITSKDRDATNALDNLSRFASSDDMLEIATTAKNVSVRELALPHVTDMKSLKKIALKDPAVALKLLPKFKDDKEFLKKLLLESTSEKVQMNLVRRVKDQDVLKKVASGEGPVALEALQYINDESFLNEILFASQNIEVVKKLLVNKNLSIDTLKKAVMENKFMAHGGGRIEPVLFETIDKLIEAKKFDRTVFDAVSNNAENSRTIAKLLKKLGEAGHGDEIEKIALDKHSAATYAFDLERKNPEFALKALKEAKNAVVRLEAHLWISPDDLKPDMVEALIKAKSDTAYPNEISKDLLLKAYQIGNEEEQDALVSSISDRHYNARHHKEKSEEDYPYMKPRTQYKDQKGLIKEADHGVIENHNQELLRMLVRHAR